MKSAGIGQWLMRGVAGSLMLVAGTVFANPEPWDWNMPRGVTPTSHEVYQLHMLGFWACIGIGVVVFGAMFVAMYRFRHSRGAVPETWSHNTKLEVLWTVIPVLILIGLAWPATNVLVKMADTSGSELTVKITGYQWLWRYQYVEYQGAPVQDVDFVSRLAESSNKARQLDSDLDPWSVKDNGYNSYLLNVDKPLVLPTNTKIRFAITAGDVIHSWWVPVLGWKTDAIPGTVNVSWSTILEPGIYRGQCAELCGQDHAFMPIVVKAVTPAEFQQWLATQQGQARLDETSLNEAPPVVLSSSATAPPRG